RIENSTSLPSDVLYCKYLPKYVRACRSDQSPAPFRSARRMALELGIAGSRERLAPVAVFSWNKSCLFIVAGPIHCCRRIVSKNSGEMNMFVENYRWKDAESIMAGGYAMPIPYPKLTMED